MIRRNIEKLLLCVLSVCAMTSCSKDGEGGGDAVQSALPAWADLQVVSVGENDFTVKTLLLDAGDSPIELMGFFWTEGVIREPDGGHNTETVKYTRDSVTITIADLKPSQTYSVRAFAINADGEGYSTTKYITTLDETFTPQVATPAVTIVSVDSVQLVSKIESDGGAEISAKGFCYSAANKQPTIDDDCLVCEAEGDSLQCLFTEAAIGTKYYVRTFATNKNGTAYSDTTSFIVVVPPTLEAVSVSNIGYTRVVVSSSLLDNGGADIVEKGFVYSTEHNLPTISDAKMLSTDMGTSLTATLDSLTPGTTYYVRAYAVNSHDIGYGAVTPITTLRASAPTLGALTIGSVYSTSAQASIVIESDGGESVTSYGFYYSTTHTTPGEGDTRVEGTLSGTQLTARLDGLTPATAYYVRAYATNVTGTTYSDTKTLTTLSPSSDTEITVSGVTFKMVAVEGGTFTMGATSEQGSDASDDEKPAHRVTLSDYYIGETEVTQGLWEAVMTYSGTTVTGETLTAYSDPWLGSNPSSSYGVGDNYPAYYVSYNDIVNVFLPRLNAITGKTFRLPTEAEWEYAARGGNKSKGYKYAGSNTIGDVAWYYGNSSTTHPVGGKVPNELGLYDMSGNVWEWCSDWYGSYSSSAQTNPTGPATGSYRVLRGGSWYGNATYCRVSYRDYNSPADRYDFYGFRLSQSE